MRSTLGSGPDRTSRAVTFPVAATAMLALAACGSAQPERNAAPPAATSASAAASPSATPTASVATVETSGPAPTSSASAPTPQLDAESAVAALGPLPAVSRSGAVVAYVDDLPDPSCV